MRKICQGWLGVVLALTLHAATQAGPISYNATHFESIGRFSNRFATVNIPDLTHGGTFFVGGGDTPQSNDPSAVGPYSGTIQRFIDNGFSFWLGYQNEGLVQPLPHLRISGFVIGKLYTYV